MHQNPAVKWEAKIPGGKLFYGVPTSPQLSSVLFLSLHITVLSLDLSCCNHLWVILQSGELMQVEKKPHHLSPPPYAEGLFLAQTS